MASKVLSLPLLLLLLASVAAAAGPVNITGSRDITKILDQFPNFSTLNKLLTQTKVADQINSRQTITVLAVADSAMSSVAGLPADVQEKVLSLHVVLDYYDIDKITNLHDATALLTTLLQASGKAAGKAGFLNATYVGDGQIKLGSAVDGILTSDVIREIAMQPYNISVIEISQVVLPPGIATPSVGGGGSAATPSPAPKAEDITPALSPPPKEEAPAVSPPPKEEAPAVSPPKAAPTLKPSTSPSPSAISPSPPKSNSSDHDSPAPTTDGPVSSPVSSPPTPSSTAPTTEAPASSADAPAGPADAPSGPADAPAGSADAPAGPSDAPAGSADAPAAGDGSSASCLTVGAGIGAAIGAAFLAAL